MTGTEAPVSPVSSTEGGEIPCAGFVLFEAGFESTEKEAPVSPLVSSHTDDVPSTVLLVSPVLRKVRHLE